MGAADVAGGVGNGFTDQESSSRLLEAADIEQGFESRLVQAGANSAAKPQWRELHQVKRMAQRVLQAPEIAARYPLEPLEPYARVERLNVFVPHVRILNLAEVLS